VRIGLLGRATADMDLISGEFGSGRIPVMDELVHF